MSDCFYKTRDLRHFYRPEQNYSGSWVTRPLLLTDSSTRISSFGSCFAGRIAQRLRKHPDFIYIRYGQQEYPDSVLNEFSAPVGNVYSVAQFDSLLRAVVEPIDVLTFIHAHQQRGGICQSSHVLAILKMKLRRLNHFHSRWKALKIA